MERSTRKRAVNGSNRFEQTGTEFWQAGQRCQVRSLIDWAEERRPPTDYPAGGPHVIKLVGFNKYASFADAHQPTMPL